MREVLEEDLVQIRELSNHIFATEELGSVKRLGGMTNRTYAV